MGRLQHYDKALHYGLCFKRYHTSSRSACFKGQRELRRCVRAASEGCVKRRVELLFFWVSNALASVYPTSAALPHGVTDLQPQSKIAKL
jgi:hypothetical protein